MTQCYKVLFLIAVIDALCDDRGAFIAYSDIAARMAETAWWPLRRYRLKTGRDDLLGRAVLSLPATTVSGAKLRATIARTLPSQRGKNGFLHYVPQRLLRPWFLGERIPLGQGVDAAIKQRSLSLRDNLCLPYGQDEVRGGVEVHPAWRDYFVKNAAVLRGWLELLWMDWLQLRNPLVPVTRRKLAAPPGRRPLLFQRTIFQRTFTAMESAGETPRCIFTGGRLAFPQAPIDHFLPWSFVAHDGLWNLVPVVDERFNSRKSDRIPDRSFILPLAALHRNVVSSIDAATPFGRAALEDYGFGLRLEVERLAAPGVLENAYAEVLPPMMATAISMGFAAFEH